VKHMMGKSSIKRKIKASWKGEISENLIDYIKERVEKDTSICIEEIIRDFKAYNKSRSFHHLPPLKRLQRILYKEADDRKGGEIGETPIIKQSSQSRGDNSYE